MLPLREKDGTDLLMLNVFYTVDVEVWCDGWNDIDSKFPAAFQSYVYGPTAAGNFGLPFQLKLLSDHGLTGVFFVEPLFAARFGIEPLREIVGMIEAAGHEVQLHLHTEWVDEGRPNTILPNSTHKRQYLRMFDLAEQTQLIGIGLDYLAQAGARRPNAFRAGSFGFNHLTLQALQAHGIVHDSSYNATMFGPDSGLAPGTLLTDCCAFDGVLEHPMTVYDDGFGRLRHAQLTASSSAEMETLLWQALERGQSEFVILSHNFELLNPAKNRADAVVVKRLEKLCRFVSDNRAHFNMSGFHGLNARTVQTQPLPLASTRWKTGMRTLEQAYRRRYQ